MNLIKISNTLQKGLGYLIHQQSSPGLWIGRISPLPYTTATCVIVLHRLGMKGTSLNKGVEWLQKAACLGRMDQFNTAMTSLAINEIEKGRQRKTSKFEDLKSHSVYPILHFLSSDQSQNSLNLNQYKGILGTIQVAYTLREPNKEKPEKIKTILAYLKTIQGMFGGFLEDIAGTACISLSLKLLKERGFYVDELLEKAVDWLKSAQLSDGGWPPFPDLRSYDTALALGALIDARGTERINSRVLQEGARQLLALQQPSGGWPWSICGIVDLDDTALAIDVLFRLGEPVAKYKKSIQLLLQSQKISGAWSAFGSDPGEVDTTCHIVSALCRMSGFHDRIMKSIKWIVSQQSKEGFWDAKWYRSQVIGTSTAIMALCLTGDTSFHEVINRGVDFLVKQQNEDGGWGIPASTPEETANALLSLSNYKESSYEHCACIEMGARWLEKSQEPSGSWNASRIGRFISGNPYLYADSVYVQSCCVRALTAVYNLFQIL